MSIRTFFDYPSQDEAAEPPEDLFFLPQWDEAKWTQLLACATTICFHANDTVLNQGDTDRSFYIITEGRLEVLIPRAANRLPQRIQMLEAGSVIGEQAFIDGKPRSATVRAITAGAMLRIGADAFEQLAAREPELAREVLFDLARLLSIKLRRANQLLAKWMK